MQKGEQTWVMKFSKGKKWPFLKYLAPKHIQLCLKIKAHQTYLNCSWEPKTTEGRKRSPECHSMDKTLAAKPGHMGSNPQVKQDMVVCTYHSRDPSPAHVSHRNTHIGCGGLKRKIPIPLGWRGCEGSTRRYLISATGKWHQIMNSRHKGHWHREFEKLRKETETSK